MIKLLFLLTALAAQDRSDKRIDTEEKLAKPCIDGIVAFEEKQRREYEKAKKTRYPKISDVALMEPDPKEEWKDVRNRKINQLLEDLRKKNNQPQS